MVLYTGIYTECKLQPTYPYWDIILEQTYPYWDMVSFAGKWGHKRAVASFHNHIHEQTYPYWDIPQSY